MRSTDQEVTIIEKIACYSQFQSRGQVMPQRATQRSTRVGQEQRELWAGAFTVVSAGRREEGVVGRFRIGWCVDFMSSMA